MANKATISAAEFMAAITGESVDYQLPGVGRVRVRSLEFSEMNKLNATHGGNTEAMMIDAVAMALVEPALTEEQVAQLHKAKAGHVVNLWQEISRLSAMGDGDVLEGEAGGGS